MVIHIMKYRNNWLELYDNFSQLMGFVFIASPPITAGPNSKYFHRNVPHDALYHNYSYCSAWLNKMATSAKTRNIIK